MAQVPKVSEDFTYDLSTNVGQVRFWSGDHPVGNAQMSDTEISYTLEQVSDDIYRAALIVLDGIEAKIQMVDASGPQGNIQRSQRLQQIQAYRKRLRQRMAGATGIQLDRELVGSRAVFQLGRWDS